MKNLLTISVFLCILLSGCTSSRGVANADAIDDMADAVPADLMEGIPYYFDEEQQEIVDCQNGLGLKLYTQLLKDPSYHDSNIAISPLSLTMNVEMLTNATAGSTREDIFKVIGLDPGKVTQEKLNQFNQTLFKRLITLDTVTKVAIANSMWFNKGLKVNPDFINTCREYYYASVRTRDLSTERTKNEINSWVRDRTFGLIPEFLTQRLSPETIFTLINTLYFKGVWDFPFYPDMTTKKPFHSISGKTVQVDMMDSETISPRSFTAPGTCFKMVGYSFYHQNFEMRFLLPDEGKTIDDCMACLTPEMLKTLHNSRVGTDYRLYLPRFEVGFKSGFRDELRALGLKTLFDKDGDFTPMSPDPGCHVSDIIQEVKVIVAEKEVEAAAVTMNWSVGYMDFDEPKVKVPIVFDRPFIYMIVDLDTGAILFIGDFKNPE